MVKIEIRLELHGKAIGEEGEDKYLGSFKRECELPAVPRVGERIALTSFGLPMAGPYMDFCKVDAVEHWPSSGSVTVVVRERARGAAGFDEVATSASTEWEIVPARN